MNVLVINLTRFGDILQTQAAVNGLAAQGHKVGMLCLDNFAQAATLLDHVDYAAALPGAKLLASLDEDWRPAAARLHELVEKWRREFAPDAVLNLTTTLSGRILARLVAGDALPLWGFGLDASGFGINGNVWGSFLQGSALRRVTSPYNLVDVFRMVCGVGDVPAVNRLRAPAPEPRAALRERLESAAPRDSAGFVAFQLGASEERRRWPVEYFAALGDRLWAEQRLCPVLLGSPAEKEIVRGYAAATHAPFADFVGATSIPELAALLPETRLLVSNDTGTMHLAAGLGVPVLAIFLATAQAWDTGPYLEGCCCLEPDLACHPCSFGAACPDGERCRNRISAESAGDLVLSFLETGVWDASARAGAEARIWHSCRGEDGFMTLRCLSGHGREDRSLWIALQRAAWRHILDELEGRPASTAVCAPQTRDFSPGFIAPVRECLARADALLHLMGEQAVLLNLKRDARSGRRLLESAARLHALLEQCPPLNALGYLWFVLTQERGGSLDSLLACAAALRRGIQHWRDLLE